MTCSADGESKSPRPPAPAIAYLQHPFLRICNDTEAMVLIAAHSRRHAADP